MRPESQYAGSSVGRVMYLLRRHRKTGEMGRPKCSSCCSLRCGDIREVSRSLSRPQPVRRSRRGLQWSVVPRAPCCAPRRPRHGELAVHLAEVQGLLVEHAVRDAVEGVLLRELEERHEDAVTALQQVGGVLVSGSCDKTLKVWTS